MTHLIIISLALVSLGYIAYRAHKRIEHQKALTQEQNKLRDESDVVRPASDETPVSEAKKRIDVRALKKNLNDADMLFAKRKFEEARGVFLKVLALDPDHEEATNKLGLIYLQENHSGKAELLFARLAELHPKNAIYFSNLALACYKQDKLDDAITAYVKAISLDKKRSARYLSLAEVYKKKHDDDLVLGCYLEASSLEPRNAELLFAISDMYEMRGNREKMLECLEKILAFEPYNKEAKQRVAGGE